MFWFLSDKEFSLYFFTVLGMLLLPGPAILYIIAQSLEQGYRAGLASAAGLAIGGSVHVLLITFGLAHFITKNPDFFNLIKLTGAFVLLAMGAAKILQKADTETEQEKKQAYGKIFYQGIMVELLNPKVIVFYLALLPQFARPQMGNVRLQFAQLGFFYIFCGLFTDTAYSVLSHQIRRIFEKQKNFIFWSQKVSGLVFITIGVLALLD